MNRPAARIGAIYRKELSDILRDRRTMLATIIIPVVLYPLLMLGFIRAAETEKERIKAERFTVEVPDEQTQRDLAEIVSTVDALNADSSRERATWDIRVGNTPAEQLGEQVHLRVQLQRRPQQPPFPPQLAVEITYTELDVHSRTGMNELSGILQDYRDLRTRRSLEGFLNAALPDGAKGGDVDLILHPVDITTVSTASEKQRGGWALGQIIPIILVLMTITGAVYPAIDLTAGERERGTLETLMAAPVPVIYLIVGKFLVVATVAMITAMLNLGSVGATMHFGGLTQAISTQMPVKFPLHVLPIILVCMVPFALLFSAVLVAVCSFARTFKEAQNYVMPVIIAAMIPGFGVLLPSVELKGATMVMPVGNMVLLTRELFQQTYTWAQVAVVLLSTTLYAAAAVAVASRLFGQEVVLFADAGSYRTLLQRRFFRPSAAPTLSQALLLAALLFPASFYAQSLIAGASVEDFLRVMKRLVQVQFIGLFLLVPLAVAVYFKIDPVNTFSLRLPPLRAWLAALLIGASSWALAHEFFAMQSLILPPSKALQEMNRLIEEQLSGAPVWLILLLLAVTPALCEEFFFRGFLLSGLSSRLTKWSAILAAGAIFGVYHFLVERMPLTMLLGILLGYLCWQSRSLLPGILVHLMHNGLVVGLGALAESWPRMLEYLPLDKISTGEHVPARILVPAVVLFVTGVALTASMRGPARAASRPRP